MQEIPEVTLYEEVGTEGRLYYNRRQGWVRLAERSDDLEVFISSDDGRNWVPFKPGASVDAPCPSRVRWRSRARKWGVAKLCW